MEKIKKYRLKKLTELEYIAVKILIQGMENTPYKSLNGMPASPLKDLAANLGYFRPNRQQYFSSLRMQLLNPFEGDPLQKFHNDEVGKMSGYIGKSIPFEELGEILTKKDEQTIDNYPCSTSRKIDHIE